MRPLIVALLVALPVIAADPPTLDEQIKKAELTDAEVKVLKEHGFVVGREEVKQVFSPYIGWGTVFVTSDSLLNAFHVLFEESVYRLELANARKLPTILADIEKQLPAAEKAIAGDADLMKKAGLRARVFLDTARVLLDPKVVPADGEVKILVEAEVERVKAAKEKSKPGWLGPTDKGFAAIDYSRFTRRGFYTRTPELERYFRSLSWLQAIPWRPDTDDEFAALLLLAKAYQEASKPDKWIGNGFWDLFDDFLGEGDAWDLPVAARYLPEKLTAEKVTECRDKVRKKATSGGMPAINDQLRFQPDTPDGKPEAHFRFISTYRLPDAALFQRTGSAKRIPSGLDVAAALGSPFARGRLKKDFPKVFDEVDKSHTLFAKRRWPQPSLYADYLDCLRVLLEQTEPDAPKLFKSDAWAAKTCQTALSGWAQMRHTWVLQAKQAVDYLSSSRTYPGFVEPVPEFYAAFAELIERCQSMFESAGAFDPTLASGQSAEELEGLLASISRAQDKGLGALTDEERKKLSAAFPDLPATGDPSKDEKLARRLKDLWDELFYRGMIVRAGVLDSITDPKHLWPALQKIVTKVERLAHRQLRGQPFRGDEEEFLKRYGSTLAHVMFYGGNSYIKPKDDAPRVVDVHTQKDKALSVGIGRPRVLWVVYPWKGNDVLCRGAVMPYYEFASSDRLTDKKWLELLDSSNVPDQPKWVKEWTVPKRR